MQVKNVRFIIAAITTLSAYSVYVSRVNLSIAIIAMVDDQHFKVANQTANATSRQPASDRSIADAGVSTITIINEPTAAKYPLAAAGQLPTSAAVVVVGQNATFGGFPKLTRALIAPEIANQSAGNVFNADSSIVATDITSNRSTHDDASEAADSPHGVPMTSDFQASSKAVRRPLINQVKFDWTHAEQGHILGAFFYGYILFQIPGARMAETVGAKWILMAANVGSAVISLAFPLSTQLNSIHLLMVLRFVLGCCQSAFFPATYVLFCRWLPEKERAVLLPIMFIGSNIGSISTYIMSSYLITSSYGWPSVFYLSGFVCTIVSILWWVYGSNSPEDNPLITQQELSYILASVGQQAEGADEPMQPLKKGKLAPTGELVIANVAEDDAITKEASWSRLLKSVPVWTLILSMYGNEWSNVILCYELPTYLNTALSFPIEQNGVINSFFQLTFAVASPIFSSLGAYILARHLFGMKKIHVRKLFQSLATFGQLACFVGVPVCGANRGLIILLMFSAVVFKACANAGDIMVPGDLSPEFAGTIFAFANSIGNTAGFFAPLLAGILVKDPFRREEWTPFWLFTASIMCFSGLIFLIFGQTSRQDYFRRTKPCCNLDYTDTTVNVERAEAIRARKACCVKKTEVNGDYNHKREATTNFHCNETQQAPAASLSQNGNKKSGKKQQTVLVLK